ncbi:ATP synthase, subunit D [Oratosquilla oratoria]|uniref:ATP synthase, subunit D n=1 Tax=Oratosquilla oratoria TaxID=337810 RepID=UPI003F776FF4
MAGRRVAATAVDWAAFAARVPEAQKVSFNAFKGKSDGYLRKVLSLPESTPAIDWAMYQSRISVPGMVEAFQKQYEALQIPYPEDTVSASVDAVAKETVGEISNFVKASEARIAGYENELARYAAMIPYNQMTMEEWAEFSPEQALRPLENPTLWPHAPEDQVGYVAEETAQ